MLDSDALKKYMQNHGVVKLGGFSPETLRRYFPSMTREAIAQYVEEGGKLHHDTVGPGEAVVLPFSFI